jgi:hypothetical protein
MDTDEDADRKIEDRKMRANAIFLSSIFLSICVYPCPSVVVLNYHG